MRENLLNLYHIIINWACKINARTCDKHRKCGVLLLSPRQFIIRWICSMVSSSITLDFHQSFSASFYANIHSTRALPVASSLGVAPFQLLLGAFAKQFYVNLVVFSKKFLIRDTLAFMEKKSSVDASTTISPPSINSIRSATF